MYKRQEEALAKLDFLGEMYKDQLQEDEVKIAPDEILSSQKPKTASAQESDIQYSHSLEDLLIIEEED